MGDLDNSVARHHGDFFYRHPATMHFYQLDPHDPTTIIPSTLKDMDFDQRTLVIFPGARVCDPYKISDQGKRNEMKNLLVSILQRGKRLTATPPSGEKPHQVFVAAWSDPAEEEILSDHSGGNAKLLLKLLNNPSYFYGDEARIFSNDFKKKMERDDPTDEVLHQRIHNVTFMGWSYGSSFLQQCMNYMHREDAMPVHVLCVSSVLNPHSLHEKAFPGLYISGMNDTIIKDYMEKSHSARGYMGTDPAKWQNFITQHYSGFDQERPHDYDDESANPLCVSEKPDVAHAVMLMPNRLVRKDTKTGGTRTDEEPTGHLPASSIDSLQGSKYVTPAGDEYPAWEQSLIFHEAARHILWRDRALSVQEFLEAPTPELPNAHPEQPDFNVTLTTIRKLLRSPPDYSRAEKWGDYDQEGLGLA